MIQIDIQQKPLIQVDVKSKGLALEQRVIELNLYWDSLSTARLLNWIDAAPEGQTGKEYFISYNTGFFDTQSDTESLSGGFINPGIAYDTPIATLSIDWDAYTLSAAIDTDASIWQQGATSNYITIELLKPGGGLEFKNVSLPTPIQSNFSYDLNNFLISDPICAYVRFYTLSPVNQTRRYMCDPVKL